MLKYTFSAEGFESTDKLQKYVEGKVKELEKYVPRASRESALLTVRVKRTKTKAEMYDATLELKLKNVTLIGKEKVEHAYSSVDVTFAELRRQLADYKGKHSKQSLQRKVVRFFKRSPVTPEE